MKASFSFKKFLFLVSIFFIILGCSKNEDIITYDLTGNWRVISFVENSSKKIIKTKDNTWSDFNNGDITINFDEPDNSGQGVFSGINVTNGFSGNYIVNESGEITIGPITSTYINEPEWAKLFKISDVKNYEVRNSNLIIYRNNKKSSITLVRI